MRLPSYSAALAVAAVALSSAAFAQTSPRARELGVPFDGTPGPLDAITDVKGIEVGDTTLISGDVTVIFPRGKANSDPVYAGWFAQNGNGEMTGTTWLEESASWRLRSLLRTRT